MNFKDLNLGDVFKVTEHPGIVIRPERLWLKESSSRARVVGKEPGTQTLTAGDLRDAVIEVVAPADASPIRRFGDALILKGGDVVLTRLHPFRVYRCTPKETFIEFVLTGSSFSSSETNAQTPDTGLPFTIDRGARILGRGSSGSMIFAYRGRVYARATSQEITGKKTIGGYRRMLTVDGVKRLVIAGLLTVPEDGALYDIIQDQFCTPGPADSLLLP
jgi:hypothetical protein